MKPPRKPNANSPLQMLPEERQAQVIELMKTGSIAEVRKSLADDGLKVSSGALSEFWSWWHLRQQFKQNELDVRTLMGDLREEEPGMSDEKIFAYGQRVFSLMAMKQESAEDWARIQKTRQREELVVLEKKKFQRETCELFLKWFNDQKVKTILDGDATNDAKTEQLGQTIFGEDWK